MRPPSQTPPSPSAAGNSEQRHTADRRPDREEDRNRHSTGLGDQRGNDSNQQEGQQQSVRMMMPRPLSFTSWSLQASSSSSSSSTQMDHHVVNADDADRSVMRTVNDDRAMLVDDTNSPYTAAVFDIRGRANEERRCGTSTRNDNGEEGNTTFMSADLRRKLNGILQSALRVVEDEDWLGPPSGTTTGFDIRRRGGLDDTHNMIRQEQEEARTSSEEDDADDDSSTE